MTNGQKRKEGEKSGSISLRTQGKIVGRTAPLISPGTIFRRGIVNSELLYLAAAAEKGQYWRCSRANDSKARRERRRAV